MKVLMDLRGYGGWAAMLWGNQQHGSGACTRRSMVFAGVQFGGLESTPDFFM